MDGLRHGVGGGVNIQTRHMGGRWDVARNYEQLHSFYIMNGQRINMNGGCHGGYGFIIVGGCIPVFP